MKLQELKKSSELLTFPRKALEIVCWARCWSLADISRSFNKAQNLDFIFFDGWLVCNMNKK